MSLPAPLYRLLAVNIYFQYYPEYRPVPLPGGFSSTTVSFDTAMANTGKMLAAIRPKLRGIFIEGKRYKKSGILFFGLEPEKAQQLNLFADTRQDEKDARLSEALDQINRKFGKGTLFHLAEGIERPWSMKRNMLSPSYTTDWNQLPEVKITASGDWMNHHDKFRRPLLFRLCGNILFLNIFCI